MPGAETYIDAMNNGVVDRAWQIDYGHLHQFACGVKAEIGCAKLWGSPPPNDSFWAMVERNGFDVKTFDKNFASKEKS